MPKELRHFKASLFLYETPSNTFNEEAEGELSTLRAQLARMCTSNEKAILAVKTEKERRLDDG